MRERICLVFFCMLTSFLAQAQLLDLSQLQINGTLPKTILNSRSVVLVKTADKAAGSGQEPWKNVAEEAHKYFKGAGIDAVAYYDWRNVNAGPDATTAFAEAFRQRAIDNLVVVERNNGEYKIIISPVGKEGLIAKGSAAWQQSGPEIGPIVNTLQNDAGQADLKLGNFLIIDKPEYFYTTDIRLNKRFFSYAPDLKLDKLAVPAYEIFVEKGKSDSLSGIKSLMQAYPYQWGITKTGTDEKDLRLKEGYQYVLLYLHTSAANIRRFLNYGSNEEIPLELQANLNDDSSVYKFYIRHIYTGDVYAGTHWDAAPAYEEALSNYLANLRKDQAASIK